MVTFEISPVWGHLITMDLIEWLFSSGENLHSNLKKSEMPEEEVEGSICPIHKRHT